LRTPLRVLQQFPVNVGLFCQCRSLLTLAHTSFCNSFLSMIWITFLAVYYCAELHAFGSDLQVCVCVRVSVCLCVCVFTCMYMYVHICVCIYTHTHTLNFHTYTHTQTHTHYTRPFRTRCTRIEHASWQSSAQVASALVGLFWLYSRSLLTLAHTSQEKYPLLSRSLLAL